MNKQNPITALIKDCDKAIEALSKEILELEKGAYEAVANFWGVAVLSVKPYATAIIEHNRKNINWLNQKKEFYKKYEVNLHHPRKFESLHDKVEEAIMNYLGLNKE